VKRRKTVPKLSARQVAANKLVTLEDLDRRSRAAQQAFEFRDKLLVERGGAVSLLRHQMINTVAVLNAMIEDGLTRWVAGQDIDHVALLSLINARRREAEMIGLDPEPRDITPSIDEYLKRKT
jgi:hypothetical protein